MLKIPVSKPSISDLEKKYVHDAMESGWVSSKGPYIPRFEQAWAQLNNKSYGVACSSGTTALTLALRALGIKEGDEVIVPEFTMIATAWAVTYCGATPVFVDCKDDLTIDPVLVEAKITSKTRAIIPVHIYGRRCDMQSLQEIAHDYNLFIVEDMAEAHGIAPMSDIACYSFFGNKILTTGEGGMCLTNDHRLSEQMKHLRSMAFDAEHTFLHKKIGYNFRMTNMQAAIGLAQVERFPEIRRKRDLIERWYNRHLPKKFRMPGRNVLWVYDIQTVDNLKLVQKLRGSGIESRVFFKPMSMQPMYYKPSHIETNAYKWSKKGLYLPTFTDMTEEDVVQVCRALVV